MSFGSLSANAIRALNGGARKGGFAHDTGEGGYSPYHREDGGDIVWEIGSGYFGCRNPDGTFSPERFAEGASNQQVKMVELKLSQGAKPGHGGVLPAPKVSQEISLTRGVPMGEDCISPSSHSAFSTPVEMMRFIAEMRRLSGGKPAGFKLCIGHEWEFLAICKAMLETGIYPDFIVVDGKEGGTGAAPMEFIDHIGKPMRQGLYFVHNALVGIGVRDHIKLGVAGKIITAFDIVRAMALGADWCNAARGFMFAVGCIQSQKLPHRPLPDRRRHPGPDPPARAGRAGQDRAGRQLPPRDPARAGRDDCGRRARPSTGIQADPHFAPHLAQRGRHLRRHVPVAGRGRAHSRLGQPALAASLGPGELPFVPRGGVGSPHVAALTQCATPHFVGRN